MTSWARLVIKQLEDHVDDVESMRCLGFCVSIDHAKFMADHFNSHGIKAVAVWGDSPDDDRRAALQDLAQGRVQVVFSVDLFNEGVDVPAVDAVLMLRPTESATLFLQQLGRGLRRSPNKSVLHRPRLRRNAPHGVPIRPQVPSAARRVTSRCRACRRGGLPVPARRMPHGARRCGAGKSSFEAFVAPSHRGGPRRSTSFVTSRRRSGNDISLSAYLAESGLDLSDVYDARNLGQTCARPPACPCLRQDHSRTLCDAVLAGCAMSTTRSVLGRMPRSPGAIRHRRSRS